MYELILVSQSPRRKQLLAEAGFACRTDSVKVSEIIDENLNLDDAIKAVARQKAEAYLERHKHLRKQKILLLAADTVVIADDKVLGKPRDAAQAREFLGLLAGRSHQVKTALCIYDAMHNEWVEELETTNVVIKPLTLEMINDYIRTGEPMDKAGAYAIQGEAKKFVKQIQGSWSNVVGLPMEKLKEVIQKHGWQLSHRKG